MLISGAEAKKAYEEAKANGETTFEEGKHRAGAAAEEGRGRSKTLPISVSTPFLIQEVINI